MKRQDKYPDTKTFTYYNANPHNRITGDCVARAISTATGMPYKETVLSMAMFQGATGFDVTSPNGLKGYMKLIGWEIHKQPRKADNTKYTGAEFCEVLQRWLGDKYNIGNEWGDGIIIESRIIANIGGGHTVAIIDGKVLDIWDSTDGCIGNYWTKK